MTSAWPSTRLRCIEHDPRWPLYFESEGVVDGLAGSVGERRADPGKGGVCGPNEYLSPSNIVPVIKSFDLDITDGTLDISLPASANQGFLSAIEILPI